MSAESNPTTARTEPAELSIVIVNWNVRDLLRSCLNSIAADRGKLDVEVIVVDAASHDNSVEMIETDFPWVRLIACSENVGFPGGNNIGIVEASGQYIMLLNPDTEILPGALQTMVSFLEEHPDIGVLGPQLLNSDFSVQSSRRRFPTLQTGFFESTWLEPLAPGGLLDDYYVRDLPDDRPADVDWLTGACLMLPRAIFETVGGFDEAYYMYSEELDWCRRIKTTGWRVVYYPAAQVLHHEGKSSEQAITARHINFQQAKLRYFRKHHGLVAASSLRSVLLANYIWQMSAELIKGLMGHKRDLRWQRARSYYQVLRSGLHPAGY